MGEVMNMFKVEVTFPIGPGYRERTKIIHFLTIPQGTERQAERMVKEAYEEGCGVRAVQVR